MKQGLHVIRPESTDQWKLARRLVEEYAASLHLDLGFQDFAREVSDLAAQYSPPDGAFLLAEHTGEFVGCVALRKFSDCVCEMKRLYVIPAQRGQGVGRVLAEGIVAEARRLGYHRMLLDTLEFMLEAQTLYRSLGFAPTAAYRFNPVPGTSFLERWL